MDISRDTARRFILGRQGLWPGRRWQGLTGTDKAMRAMQHLQLDPLAIMARAQDLALFGRVIDYRPDDWAMLTYGKRRFFDWGGWLAVRPMEELPFWRTEMRREMAWPHWQAFAVEHADAIAEMREVLRRRPAVANRDFAMAERRRVDSYRGRKDSAIALHYLWRKGEAMITRRERFERVYARAERVAPARFRHEAPDDATDEYLRRKAVAWVGLADRTAVRLQRTPGSERDDPRPWLAARVEDGTLAEVRVDGWSGPRWALASDVPAIRAIARGRVPRGWAPLETTTQQEVTFLSPLEPVSARGRAKVLFDFDYTWEVYTPAEKRRFGYYALPVLWGDRLVARFDGRLDRPGRTLQLLGFWPEDPALLADESFLAAWDRGLDRFRRFLDADAVTGAALDAGTRRRLLGRDLAA